MITDALVNFLPDGSNVAVVATAVASNVVDLLGNGAGQAPTSIIGNASVFGTDQGIGAVKPQVQVTVGTAFTTGDSCTLNVAFQGAVDSGSGGGYEPGTWETLMETGAIAVANLTAGAVLARFDFPPAFPVGFRPRFLRLLFTPSATFTAGTIANAPVTMVRDDWAASQAASNYKV